MDAGPGQSIKDLAATALQQSIKDLQALRSAASEQEPPDESADGEPPANPLNRAERRQRLLVGNDPAEPDEPQKTQLNDKVAKASKAKPPVVAKKVAAAGGKSVRTRSNTDDGQDPVPSKVMPSGAAKADAKPGKSTAHPVPGTPPVIPPGTPDLLDLPELDLPPRRFPDARVPAAGDDDVIEHLDVQRPARLDQSSREPHVVGAGRRIARAPRRTTELRPIELLEPEGCAILRFAAGFSLSEWPDGGRDGRGCVAKSESDGMGS